MSRIGSQVIEIPSATELTQNDNGVVTVKGPKGELSRSFKPSVTIAIKGSEVKLTPKGNSSHVRALWGTYASHLVNMIQGVNETFTKRLAIEGVGFRAEVQGNDLVLTVGFSHPVKLPIPEGLDVSVADNVITINGIDKEVVGQFAARVRGTKKPEPYKGKGIRYEDEVVRRKEGKTSV
ncbi:MAG: 50S ribosomal protein L6 [Candidatus Paceibacterota bacterium]